MSTMWSELSTCPNGVSYSGRYFNIDSIGRDVRYKIGLPPVSDRRVFSSCFSLPTLAVGECVLNLSQKASDCPMTERVDVSHVAVQRLRSLVSDGGGSVQPCPDNEGQWEIAPVDCPVAHGASAISTRVTGTYKKHLLKRYRECYALCCGQPYLLILLFVCLSSVPT